MALDRFLAGLPVLLMCWSTGNSGQDQPSKGPGFLVVTVTTGDDQGPAMSALVLVHAYGPVYR